MTTYKNIKGFGIQYLDSDPANPITGQVWYNNTTKALKGTTAGGGPVGTWASGANVNTARSLLSGFGASNSNNIITGGSGAPPVGGPDTDWVESYNGTSWSEIAEFNTARNNHGSFGTTTAGLITGGLGPGTIALTETWNGSSWTEVNDLNTARSLFITSCNGTQTAGLAGPGASQQQIVETWDGSSWSEVAETNTNVYLRGGTGNAPSTSTMLFGGGYPRNANTEIWNGSCWTEVAELNTARTDAGGAGNSITSAIAYGGRGDTGSPNSKELTESWDGTSWAEVADQGNAGTFYFADGGGSGSALKTAGANNGVSPQHTNATEEWSAPDFVTKTFTVS